ncbi:hypothetical protein E3N88_28880 [Mikania micrantha]|uniref:Integrase catalytic domain-containing protein n=1 Tax=Mikania micrantha TaxID=192012 RepID=A0A5N6N0S1_9ASTR|nr:hypothetical protein E3N88_28880 [Mikania micrantha]
MERLLLRRKFLTPDSIFPPSSETLMIWSELAMLARRQAISLRVMRCPRMESKCIPVAVDYVSKWVEAQALPTNDARVVVRFLKELFSCFGAPKALISDRGTHFCNSQHDKALSRYGGIKRILEKAVGQNRKDWSVKLNDALWAFRSAYKTPIGTTPFKLIYGKTCHLPVELEHKAYWALKSINMDLTSAGEN